MFEFKKYSKIPEASNLILSKIEESGIDTSDWVALEKIHGANYAFYVHNGIYKPACRSKFLDNPGEFYNSNLAVEKIIPNIIQLSDMFPDTTIRLCGELFGGRYPHPDVPKVPNVSRIQKGVWYSPDVWFYLFDIVINDKYIPHDEVVDIGKRIGIIVAEPLHRGSLRELMEVSEEFETTVPEMLGLPKIDDNLAEGLVIKPNNPTFFRSGKRVILKRKNPKFRERQAKRKERKPIKTIELLDQSAKEFYNKLSSYITEQRLDNMISHGETYKNFGAIQGAYVQDMLEELEQNEGITIHSLDKKDRKVIMKQIMKEVSNVIRPKLNELLEV